MQTTIFLLLFLVAVIACLVYVVRYPKNVKQKAKEKPPELPDPYAIKYFNDGYFSLMLFVLLNLHAGGYIRLSMNKRETILGIKRTPMQDRPDETLLDPLEQAVYRFIPNEATGAQKLITIILNSIKMRAAVTEAAKVYAVDWEQYGFANGPAFHKPYKRIVFRLQLAVIAAGLSQFITSIVIGPDASIILVIVLTVAGALSIGFARNRNALNDRGKKYINTLRAQYKGKKIKEIFTREEQVAAALLGSKIYTGSLLKSAKLYGQAYEDFMNPVPEYDRFD